MKYEFVISRGSTRENVGLAVEQVRTISIKRLRRRRGFVSPEILAQLRKVVLEFLVD